MKDYNEVSEPVMFSEADFFKTYPSRSNRVSEYYTPTFIAAVELAIDNPDMFVRFYSFSSQELLAVRRKAGACSTFAKKYFKDNDMDNFVVFSRTLGNKCEIFMVNSSDPVNVFTKHNTKHKLKS